MPLPAALQVGPVKLKPPFFLDDAELAPVLVLLQADIEAQRIEEQVSEAYVGQPWFFQIYLQREMVELRAVVSVFSRHPGGQQSDLESEFAQQGRERAIQFIAEAASPLLDDLAEEGIFFAHNLPPERYIEILKRNGE